MVKQRWNWAKVSTGIGFVLMALFVPILPGTASYERVRPGSISDEGVGLKDDERIVRRGFMAKRFLLDHGKLYLLRQQTWHALVLVTRVHHVTWSADELQELRRQSPEIDRDELWR